MITTTVYGRFHFFPYDCIGHMLSTGMFWDACLRPYMDVLQPGEVYVDIGANIGFFPVYLGKRGIQYHAFEASPEVFTLLETNLVENHVADKGVAYNVALYDSETELVLHRDWKQWVAHDPGVPDYEHCGNSGWLCLVKKDIGDNVQKFQAKTLDSFHIQDVKLIKVDVQGCDLRALYGGVETIKAHRPVILFEYEDFVSIAHGDTWDKYETFFAELDYRITRIGSVEYVGEPNGRL